MTEQEVIQAYKDRYAAFPDLVERIVGQFDWAIFESDPHVMIRSFGQWCNTKEGHYFWAKINSLEYHEGITRQSIDAAYKEFGIATLIDMKVEESYYWPLFSHMSRVHNLPLIDSEMKDIIEVVKGMLKVTPDQVNFNASLKIADLRPVLLRHPDKEMVLKSCLHYLGDEAQEWYKSKHV